jgi:antitoxin component of MazEF toxin-antitoxin module
LKVKLDTIAVENEKMLRQYARSQHNTIDAELSLKVQNDTLRARIKERKGETNSLSGNTAGTAENSEHERLTSEICRH